jgi:hypothetical protein
VWSPGAQPSSARFRGWSPTGILHWISIDIFIFCELRLAFSTYLQQQCYSAILILLNVGMKPTRHPTPKRVQSDQYSDIEQDF